MDPAVESVIDLLRQRSTTHDRRAVYIQLLSKHNLRASEEVLVELQERARTFLASKAEVLLILGDSGAGKSTFGLRLENDLWADYNPGGPIPLFIDLKTIDTPDKDMIRQHLDDQELFTNQQIEDLQRSRRFVLICDGYDEYHKWTNLHTKNQFNQPRHWQAKMVLTCRTQYLRPNYRNYFEPESTTIGNPNFSHTSDLFEEAVIVSFRNTQIQEYIELFTQVPKNAEFYSMDPGWSTEHYMERLRSIKHLMEMAKNPFMLKMILDVLPTIAKSTTKMTRVDLYDRFVQLHFDSEYRRLANQQSSGKMDDGMLSVFTSLKDNELTDLGLDFSKQLSHWIFKKLKGVNSVVYSVVQDSGSWKDAFFSSDARVKLLRESAQLVCRENKEDLLPQLIRYRARPHRKPNSYEFSHRSMLEYFYSCLIFDPRGNTPQLDLATCLDSTDSPSLVVSHPLGQTNIVSETSIVHFLAERVHQSEAFQDQLQTILQLSKIDMEISRAAANAITILVYAGERFNGADLRCIRVPGADLSCGDFDSAQLQGADLRDTTLRNIWLHQADLSDSQMEGVMFGQYPYLELGRRVLHCAFSRDGRHLIATLNNGAVAVYNTTTWTKACLPGHSVGSASVAHSPSGRHIASGGIDYTVRVRDAQTGAPTSSLSGHTAPVTSVAYSPSGHQIASGSFDETVRLWDTRTGILAFCLSGHARDITSVSYSTSGKQIASGSYDETVRLWDTQTGALASSLCGHTEAVASVAYSPSGHQIVSGSHDKTVRLWDAETSSLNFSLNGHTDWVTSVAYSPSGDLIASGSFDETVRLWDAQTGAFASSLNGHTGAVYSVAYSPSGRHIASGGWDETVRLWDIQNGVLTCSLRCHIGSVAYSPIGRTGTITSVAYSPTGHRIASGSHDKTVRLWDTETGALVCSLSGHTDWVSSVVFSPSGHQISSGCFDKTVRLWDTETGALSSLLSGHTGSVTSVAYSLSGHQRASGSWDKTVRLWNAQTGVLVSILSGHTEAVSSVVYSPSGHHIASGSHDKTVRLWDVQTGTLVSTLSGHTDWVTSVAYSPSGHQIASGSWDKTLRLWDIHSGQCLVTLGGFQDSVNDIAWMVTVEGSYLAMGGEDKSVRIWKVLEETNEVRVCLHWRSTRDTLVLSKASIQGAQGLSEMNARLCQQRGAIDVESTQFNTIRL